MSSAGHSSPFNNDDSFDSSFQQETNREFNKIIEFVDERETSFLQSQNKSLNLNELLLKNKSHNVSPKEVSGTHLHHSQQQSPLQQQLHRKNSSSMPHPKEPVSASRRASPTKDRLSKISLVSDISYTSPESVLDSRNVLRSSSARSTSQVNLLSRRYSTISNGSTKIVIQKRSNNSLKYGNRSSATPGSFLKNKNSSYLSGSSDNSKRNSAVFNSNGTVIDPRAKIERSYSNDSSFIGYRNSIRSFSTNMDSTIQYFDAVSINDDDERSLDENDLFVANRFSILKATTPGIVGVNNVNKNGHINDYDYDPFFSSTNSCNDNSNNTSVDNAIAFNLNSNGNILSDNDNELETVLSKSTVAKTSMDTHRRNFSTSSTKQNLTSTPIKGITGDDLHGDEMSIDSDSLPSPSGDILELPLESLPDGASSMDATSQNKHIKNSLSGSSDNFFHTFKSSNRSLENNIKSKININTEQETAKTAFQPQFYDDIPVKRKKSFNILKASLKKAGPSLKRNVSIKAKKPASQQNDDIATLVSSVSASSNNNFDSYRTQSNYRAISSDQASHNTTVGSIHHQLKKQHTGSKQLQSTPKQASKLASKSFFKFGRRSENNHKNNKSVSLVPQSSSSKSHKKSFSIMSRNSKDTFKNYHNRKGSLNRVYTTNSDEGEDVLSSNYNPDNASNATKDNDEYNNFKQKVHKRSLSFGFHKSVSSNTSNSPDIKEKIATKNESCSSAISSAHINSSSISTAGSSVFSSSSKHKPLSSLAGSNNAYIAATNSGSSNIGNKSGKESILNSSSKSNGMFSTDISSSIYADDYNFLFCPEMLSNYKKILFSATPARKIAKENGIPYLELHNLMNLCGSTNNMLLEFDDFINLRSQEMKHKSQFKKYNQLKYSEIFIEETLKSKDIANVLKVIPFNHGQKDTGNSDLDEGILSIKDVTREMQILNKLQNCQGFINLKAAAVVKGTYSKTLLKEWDFDNILFCSNLRKKRPGYYTKSQLYLILIFEYGGPSLKDFHVQSWHQCNKIFWNLVKVLKTAEFLYQLEHRNLNWDNILINDIGNNEANEAKLDSTFRRGYNNSTASFNEAYLSDDKVRPVQTIDSVGSEGGRGVKYNLDLRVSIVDFGFSRILDSSSQQVLSQNLSELTNEADTVNHALDDDYRFDVYQLMQQEIAEASNFEKTGIVDWSSHVPRTNIIWLHYLVDKLVNNKKLKPVNKLELPDDGQAEFHSRNKSALANVKLTNFSGHASGSKLSAQPQKSILRKNNDDYESTKYLQEDELFQLKEYQSYQAFLYIHKSLDPRRNTSGANRSGANRSSDACVAATVKTKPFFKTMLDDYGDLFKLYKDKHFREPVKSEDFDNLDQVLKWGELNELIL